MKKQLLIFWFLLLVAIFAASCGDDNNPTDGDEDGDTDNEMETELETADGDTDINDSDLETSDGDTDVTDLDPDETENEEAFETEAEEEVEQRLPTSLPFEYTREDEGEPITEQEITEFTKKLMGFLADIDYFQWIYETCHGVDKSTGKPDYLIWWHDVDAVKEGDTVTFRHNRNYGGSHNNAKPTSLALVQAIAQYLSTGDEKAAVLVEQFAKSFTATMKGFVYNENDKIDWLMTRNIITQNHSFTMPNGKKKAVDYSDWYFSYEGWNAERYHYPDNPTWGDIWVTTKRSKDDIPHLYRATGWFPYVLKYGKDEYVKEAVQEAYDYMKLFAKDIVDNGYYVRTKDENGEAYIPMGKEQDHASLIGYVEILDEYAECDARLATALLAYGDTRDIDCASGQGSIYDDFAININYFNGQIINSFHMNAVQYALLNHYDDEAKALLEGLVTRIERYLDPESGAAGQSRTSFEKDMALLLLEAGSVGYPLTSEEARKIHYFFSNTVDVYKDFPNWDLWDDSVADGTYSFRDQFHPKELDDTIGMEEIAFVIEYCWSPFRNESSVDFVDCDIVKDPSRWKE